MSEYLETIDRDIMLTGDVGLGILEKMTKKPEYIKDYGDCYKLAVKNNRNLLFIYRSNYSNLSQR